MRRFSVSPTTRSRDSHGCPTPAGAARGITLGAAAFVAYCLAYGWLDHHEPAPTLQMRPALALELDALADDAEIELSPTI